MPLNTVHDLGLCCGWCGLPIADDDGGHCTTCNRDTCIDCGARLVTPEDGSGPIDGHKWTAHLGPDCYWANYWGWTIIDDGQVIR